MTNGKEMEYKKEKIQHKGSVKGDLTKHLYVNLQQQEDIEFQEGDN